jgi:lipopolysaccharide/colanic/teichoic acid biosynthesis glycosyltransferase
MIKRAFDVICAGVALSVLALPLAGLAVLIRFTSKGPVFYRGVRAGRYGRPFRIFKFRTMVQNADKIGGPSTAGDDTRLTSVGRWMRRFKIDELPQLINVVLGDMSLVGPRPEILSEVEAYTGEQRRVLELRPGITDWASIWNSNEERVLAGAADPHAAYKQLIQPTKLHLQLEYYRERTFAVDLLILASTILKLFRPGWVPRRLKAYGQPVPASSAADLRTC